MEYIKITSEEIPQLQRDLDLWKKFLEVKTFVGKYYKRTAVSARIILHYVTEDLAVPGDVDVRDDKNVRLVITLPPEHIQDFLDNQWDELVSLPIEPITYNLVNYRGLELYRETASTKDNVID